METKVSNVSTEPGMKSVHTEYSSSLLMLLFIFLKVRDREWERHEEQKLDPAPVHRKKPARFTIPDSSTHKGLEQQGFWSQKSQGGPLVSFTSLPPASFSEAGHWGAQGP